MIAALIGIELASLLIVLAMCRAAAEGDRIHRESRRAMPDGSRAVEANNDAPRSVEHPPAHVVTLITTAKTLELTRRELGVLTVPEIVELEHARPR